MDKVISNTSSYPTPPPPPQEKKVPVYITNTCLSFNVLLIFHQINDHKTPDKRPTNLQFDVCLFTDRYITSNIGIGAVFL